jgi:hypothetical protein
MRDLWLSAALATGDADSRRDSSYALMCQNGHQNQTSGPSRQNICHPELGIWSHQWLVQVDVTFAAFKSCTVRMQACCSSSPFPTFSAAGALWKALIWDLLELARCTQSQTMFGCLSLCPQTDAGYVSGSSIAAAAFGLCHMCL